MSQPELILASGSSYRRQQLLRLGLDCRSLAPDVDETPHRDEDPANLAMRLALRKAKAVALRCAGTCIIAADQVAACAGQLIGKPGSAAAQQSQLLSCSGQQVSFYTALVVIDANNAVHTHLDTTVCHVRALNEDEVARYVALEPAYDCAGGFKVEGLGITLFERIISDDPTALIGLPLLALCRILRGIGLPIV